MAKSLVITEKPSVARDIAAALGGLADHDGYFEGDRTIVTFAVGHLFELLSPEEVDPVYKRWTLDTLPILPAEFRLKPKPRQSERIRTIRKLLERRDVDEVVNACDAGREGELIFREIVKHLGTTKPIRRLWLQSMTEDSIREGFERLRSGEELEGLAAAAESRAAADWLIGMNATRALTKRLRGRRERGAWSAGRVQTPTLAILVERELEVLAHAPRPYWRVLGTFEHEGNRYVGTWFDPSFRAGADEEAKDDRVFDEARARAVEAAVAGRPGQAEETRKPSRETAPPLFDLTSLQREANRRFGWAARRTLSAAQRCYEAHKILTYPRTDSRCLPSDYRGPVRRALEAFSTQRGRGDSAEGRPPLGDYAVAAARLLRDGLENEARTFDDSKVSDHFAIIPTGAVPRQPLSGDDRRLFDMVVRRFLATFHPAAVWERVERTTSVGDHRFRSRARTLVEPGWRAVLEGGPSEEETALPPLRPGQSEASGVAVATAEVSVEADQTKPPPRITEARLLSLMENAGQQIEDEDLAAALHEKGIGTPATRADIIENLIQKGYVLRQGKVIRPTAKGIRLIDILRRIHIDRLASPALTGEIEFHLNEVERGRRTASTFLEEMQDYARDIVSHAKNFEYDELYANEPPLGPCPRCGRPVYERAWFYRCREDPNAEEDCPVRIWKDTSGRYIDRRTVATLLRDGKTEPLEGFTARNGRPYRAVLEIDRERWTARARSIGWEEGEAARAEPTYDVDPEPLGRCPFDEDCVVVESPTHFLCERKLKEAELAPDADRPKSCGFTLPRTVCRRELTRDEAMVYLKAGRTELLTDFISRFGRPFSARLVLKKNGRHGFEFPPRAPRGAKRAKTEDAEAAPTPTRSRGKKTSGSARPHRAAPSAAAKPRKKAAAARRGSRSAKRTAPRTRRTSDDETEGR